MSTIQLIIDGVTVYQSGTAAPGPTPPAPPAPTPPAPTPPAPPSNVAVNASINGADAKARVWSNPTNSAPLWPANQPHVTRVTIPAGNTTAGRWPGTIDFSDAGSERGPRIVSISQTPGDFGPTAQWVSKIPSNANSASFVVDDPRAADIRLTPGVWYINVKNMQSAGDFLIDWAN